MTRRKRGATAAVRGGWWVVPLVFLAATASATTPQVGDLAPDFELAGTDGKVHRLSEYRGQQPVVLAWYPQAFTSGCTLECRSFAQDGHLIRELGVRFFMASVDLPEVNARFADAMKADFPLLSDPDKATAKLYGVLHQNRFAFRTNFYIGADGRILKIDRNVNPATAARDVADTLQSLGLGRSEP